ncbi:MAG: hypothetical protein PHX82_12920, partial [Paracoccaceae bacterium]|nr:hypothetical protein [Paracoccaceae bacterium]
MMRPTMALPCPINAALASPVLAGYAMGMKDTSQFLPAPSPAKWRNVIVLVLAQAVLGAQMSMIFTV